jgi:PST family polysaccharide transporter
LEQLLAPLSAILIPVLSRLQSDPERYRRTFIRAYDTLALTAFPFAALGLVLAEPLVLVVLGPKWNGVVPLFAGFTLVALSLPLSIPASCLFMSQGRGRDLLQTYSLLSFVTVAAFVIGLPWGPLGVVLALAAASLVIRLPILYYLAGRRGPVRTADLWKGFVAYLPCWGAVYAATALAHGMLGAAPPLVQVLVCAPAGLAGGAVAVLVFERPRASAFYTWQTVRHSLARQWSGAA